MSCRSCRRASTPVDTRADFGDRAVGVADLAEATGLAAHRVVDQAADLGAVDRLVLEEGTGHRVETEAVLLDELAGPRFFVAKDALDLFVDDAGGLVGVVARVHQVLAEEDRALASPTPSDRCAPTCPTRAPSCGRAR